MDASPKFCIYGAGAIGGMLGTLLVRAGATVSMVARGETLAALQRDGLRLVIDGETLQAPVQASADPAELGPQDYLVIAVKAPALREVASRLGPLLGPKTAVVPAMNGVPWWFFANAKGALAGQKLVAVDPDGVIGRAIATTRVIGCAIHIACSRDAPGIIHHSGGRRLIIGEPGERPTARLARLARWLRSAGLDCVESTDIRRDIWFKLWGNLCMNPISMLTAATSDRIIDDPLVHTLCVSMMEEAARIGEAIGIAGTPSAETMIAMTRAVGPFKTSMLQDVEHGRPVEIDALLTVTHDIGRLVGVPTPFIDSVLGLARLRATGLGLLDRAA